MSYQIFTIVFSILFSSIPISENIRRPNVPDMIDFFGLKNVGKLGDHPFPTNPMSDRAKGYLLQGKAQTAILNYGNYIDIEISPNGAWGEYSYLYEVSFLAGVPGQSYSSKYSWENIETIMNDDGVPIYKHMAIPRSIRYLVCQWGYKFCWYSF